MKLTLIEKKPEAGDAMSFFFKPEGELAWQAGQFMHYVLPHENADARKTERWFTISNAPHEKLVRITTRFSPTHSTFKGALQNLAIGATIEADGPEGDFVMESAALPFVLIAGGIGITPYRSILMDLDHRGEELKGKLLYANRSDDYVFKDELEALKAKHPGFSIHYFTGEKHIDEAAIREQAPNLSRPVFYVSGPEPMTEAFEKMLGGMGIEEARMKRDYFPGYAWPLT